MLIPAPVFTASTAVTTSATCAASLTSDGATFWYVSGFDITFGGATAGALVLATLSGILGGTESFVISVPTGITTAGALSIQFPIALASADINTAIALTLPAVGAGSTAAAVSLHGYKGNKTLGS